MITKFDNDHIIWVGHRMNGLVTQNDDHWVAKDQYGRTIGYFNDFMSAYNFARNYSRNLEYNEEEVA